MPVSKDKSILFARAADGKVTHQWPVAVFNQPAQAKSYVSMLRIALKSGSTEAVDLLDKRHVKNAEGAHLADVKYSIATVPYCPQPAFSDDDAVGEASL